MFACKTRATEENQIAGTHSMADFLNFKLELSEDLTIAPPWPYQRTKIYSVTVIQLCKK